VLLTGAVALAVGHFHRLPSDYSAEIHFAAHTHFRDSLTAPWLASEMRPRRFDQTVSSTPEVSLIQCDLQWTTLAGEVTYESAGLYGVDRSSHANAADYGNRTRTGQFLFPLHTRKQDYELWDPFYTGPRRCRFIREEVIGGLSVYLFSCDAEDIDDTAGYMALPDVPKLYLARSNGSGYAWVEPLSGVIVGFFDHGRSYLVDRTTLEPRGDFYWWSASYAPETTAAQMQLARHNRTRILMQERWLPFGLVLGALLVLTFPAAARRALPR
jgi:hypothetical protein